jgi:hypothetical protein
MYGNQIAVSEFHPLRSLIGQIERSQSGNVILRIGREWTDDDERGWEQTEHVVLVPLEVTRLMHELAEYLPSKPKPDAEAVLFRLDRELATLILDKLNGNTVKHERYDQFHERLADFVHPDQEA